MSNSLCVSSFLPALHDRQVVVCLSLLHQLFVRPSWRFIHFFRRHLLHVSSPSRESPFRSRIWAWTFFFICICFLKDLDKECRESPDRFSFQNNDTDVVTERVTVLFDYKVLHQWVVIRSASSHLLLYFHSDTMSKIIQILYRDLFSSTVINRHIVLSLFLQHESVRYVTDIMVNFDSDTGHQKTIFSSSLPVNVASLPSRPSNFVMKWRFWDLLDIDLSRKRRRSFDHKFMLDNR